VANKVIFITATGAGTWTVPADWNSSSNSIEVIGGGGGGRTAASAGAGGGGGGQYRKLTNIVKSPSTVINLAVGAGAAAGANGGDTFWDGTTFAGAALSAQGGLGATSATGALGGSTGTGGTGANGGQGGLGGATAFTGGGGGGAAGPGGVGGTGGAGDNSASGADFGGGGGSGAGTSSAGGTGGAGTTSAGLGGTNANGGGQGGDGGSGAGTACLVNSTWTSTHLPDATTVSTVTKSTGGGGGGGGSAAGAGGSALVTNAHGGGGGGAGNGTAGSGGDGLIVIRYTVPPVFGELLGTLGVFLSANITNPLVATGSVAVVAGDLLVAVIAEVTNLTVTAVTDNLGNSYTAQNAGSLAGTARSGRMFYSIVTNAGTLTTVNAATTASADSASMTVAAYRGPFSGIDANPANITRVSQPSPHDAPATGTLLQASELVVSWAAWGGINNGTAIAPLVAALPQVNLSNAGAFLVAATTSVTPSWGTAAGTYSVIGTASFPQSGGGGGGAKAFPPFSRPPRFLPAQRRF
jgi:hypothetical protein